MKIETPAQSAASAKSWLLEANRVLRLTPKQVKALTESEREALVIGLRGFTSSQTCAEACAKLDTKHEWH